MVFLVANLQMLNFNICFYSITIGLSPSGQFFDITNKASHLRGLVAVWMPDLGLDPGGVVLRLAVGFEVFVEPVDEVSVPQ